MVEDGIDIASCGDQGPIVALLEIGDIHDLAESERRRLLTLYRRRA